MTSETLSPERWRCECGGAWEPEERAGFEPGLIDATDASIWRYRRLYGLGFDHSDHLADRINAVTMTELKRVAAKYLTRPHLVCVTTPKPELVQYPPQQ